MNESVVSVAQFIFKKIARSTQVKITPPVAASPALQLFHYCAAR